MLQQLKRLRVALVATIFMSAALAPAFVGVESASAANVTCPNGADRTWVGTTNSDWTVNANWNPATAPTAGQTACIGAGANQPIVTSSVNILSLISAAGTTVNINTGGNLTTSAASSFNNLVITGGTFTQAGSGGTGVDGNFNFNGGTLAGPNGIGVTGTTTFATGAAKNIAQDLFLNGTTNWTGGNITSTGGGIHNAGTFNANSVGDTIALSGTFDNTGTLRHVTNNGPIAINGNIANSSTGVIEAGSSNIISQSASHTFTNAGMLNLTGALNLNGNTFTHTAGAVTISGGNLAAGVYNQSGGSTVITGALTATTSISGGSFMADGDVTGNVALSGGTFAIADTPGQAETLDLTGNFTQTGGTLGFRVLSGGTIPGTNYDSLAVSGAFAVSGPSVLAITTPSYDPTTYVADVVTYAGTATGTYATVNSDVTNKDWIPTYGPSPLTITLADAVVVPVTPVTPVPTAGEPMASNTGYWLTGGDGKVYNFGNAKALGMPSSGRLNQPTVGLSPTPTGNGYYVAARDGGVFTYGDAAFAGSLGAQKLNQPVVGVAANPAGPGYWMVASDGGVFAFGGAGFYGSTGDKKLNAPVLNIVPTATGKGYWLVAADGGVFSFGDASFKGSTGDKKLNAPIVGMTADIATGGYWLVASDGGVFSFGGAKFNGSTGNIKLNSPVVNIRANNTGTGYWLVAADGGVFSFGTAKFYGTPGTTLTNPIVG